MASSCNSTAAKDADRREPKETITVRCDLRHILTLASHESATISTVLAMGLLPVVEKMAQRAHELNDPELEEHLDLLGL